VIDMRNLRILIPALFVLCIGVVTTASAQTVAALDGSGNSGLARVWFLWTSDSTVGGDTGATPTIYANGTPLGALRAGSVFSHDFLPGTYQFSVDSYGLPTGKTYAAQLTPGMQLYLQIQYLPTWQEGIPSGGWAPTDYSFFVIPMAPQLAQAYLPTLTNLGAR
jgi:hypothetical protein